MQNTLACRAAYHAHADLRQIQKGIHSMDKAPVLFISHGSPALALTDSPAHRFLTQLGRSLPRPDAIVMVSAHWEAMGGVAVSFAPQPETIYDFGGFSPALKTIRYPAPGAPDVAQQVADQLEQAGFQVKRSTTRGLDHGAWVPLHLMYPEADIPTFQVSVIHGASAAEHLRLGRALAALREQNVCIIGSGSMTHNLYEFRGQPIDTQTAAWVSGFSDWMHDRIEAHETDALLDYRRQAPHAAQNHPTDEHLMPLYVAMGAAGEDWQARRIHNSVEYGVLAMDVYAFA
jgi:4,5-DOPA dioxygenase extradiol